MAFQLSPIIQPQFVASAAAALTLTVDGAGGTAAAVPALTRLSLWTCRFVNVTAAPVTLKVYRVPSGSAADAQHEAVHTITVPVATANNPFFAWDPGYTLSVGDAIWAIAGSANAISVSGDGGITS